MAFKVKGYSYLLLTEEEFKYFFRKAKKVSTLERMLYQVLERNDHDPGHWNLSTGSTKIKDLQLSVLKDLGNCLAAATKRYQELNQ